MLQCQLLGLICAFCKSKINEKDLWSHSCLSGFTPEEHELCLNEEDMIYPVPKRYVLNVNGNLEQVLINGSIDIPQDSHIDQLPVQDVTNGPGKKREVKSKQKKKDTEKLKFLAGNKENISQRSTETQRISLHTPATTTRSSLQCKRASIIDVQDDEFTERLIEEVAKRRCLWDISLPCSKRGDSQRTNAWEAIANVEFEGKCTVKDISTRWQELKKAYDKHKEKDKKIHSKPSGSGRDESQDMDDTYNEDGSIGFRFYSQMRFLDKNNEVKSMRASSIPSISSIPTCSNFSDLRTFDASCISSGPKNSRQKKRKLEDVLVDIVSSENNSVNNKEPPKDPIDTFLSYLGQNLREVPEYKKKKLQRDLLNKVFEAIDEAEGE